MAAIRDEEEQLRKRREEFLARMKTAFNGGDETPQDVLRAIEWAWFWCGRRGALIDMQEHVARLMK